MSEAMLRWEHSVPRIRPDALRSTSFSGVRRRGERESPRTLMVDDPRLAGEFLIFGRAQKCTCRKKEKNGICGEPGAMKAKSDSRVQGCAGKPLNSRCATISYMEKSEKVVASNRTPKIEKTPFSLNWCKIYDFEPRRVCEDVRGRGRFIAEIDPTWTPDRVPIGRITPLCLFYNPHPLCSLWLYVCYTHGCAASRQTRAITK